MPVKILRGIPGAGKSTLIESICRNDARQPPGEWAGKDVKVVSADFFFLKMGKYFFEPSRLGEAHLGCQKMFRAFIEDPDAHIIVDNTNTAASEFAMYISMAEMFGHTFEIITLIVDPAIAFARNVHGVPALNVFKLDQRLREETMTLPMRWPHRLIFQ